MNKFIEKIIVNPILNSRPVKKLDRVIFTGDYKNREKNDKKASDFLVISGPWNGLEKPYFKGVEGSLFLHNGIGIKTGAYRQDNIIKIGKKTRKNIFDLSEVKQISDRIETFVNYIENNKNDKNLLEKTINQLMNELNISKFKVEELIKKSIELKYIEKVGQSIYKFKGGK